MVVKFYAGDKITGLSSDTKPATASANSEFYETNTKKTYDAIQSGENLTWTERVLGVGYSISNAELEGSISYDKLLLSGAITNANLAGSISISKLANGTAGKFIGYNTVTGVPEERTVSTEGASLGDIFALG